jgi:cell wall-associated NlpC family hydrolase
MLSTNGKRNTLRAFSVTIITATMMATLAVLAPPTAQANPAKAGKPITSANMISLKEAALKARHNFKPLKPIIELAVVKPGQDLSVIAASLGHANCWPALYAYNKLAIGQDPNVITAGLNLKVPIKWNHCAPPISHYSAGPAQATISQSSPSPQAGLFTYTQLESLWVSAGGPQWAQAAAASVAECESGGNPGAFNPSGASGLWQILGQVVAGDIFDPKVNALNAVSKFSASGDTWAQWTCQPTATLTAAYSLMKSAHADVHRHFKPYPKRLKAWRWALTQLGAPYCWGGSRGCFDCSGLVMQAYLAAGIVLPRTTWGMLSDSRLYRVYHPRKGDLAFFAGGAHVELYGWGNFQLGTTYGALDWGTVVGYHKYDRAWGWAPFAFYRVRGANA